MELTNKNHKVSIWIALICGLCFLYVFTQLNLLASINTHLTHEFHNSLSLIGVISASYLIGITISFLPAGYLIDRFGAAYPIMISLGISIFSTFCLASADTLVEFILIRLVAGLAHAFVFLSVIRIVSSHYKLHKATYIGLTITIGLVGGIISQYPFVVLQNILNWRSATNIIGLGGLLIWMIAFLNRSIFNTKQKAYVFSGEQFVAVFKNKQALILGLYACLMDFPTIALGTSWGNHYLKSHYQISNLSASKILLWVYIGLMIGSPISGWLSDLIGSRKKVMIWATALLLIFTAIWCVNIPSTMLIIFVIFMIGFLSGFQVLSYPCLADITSAENQSITLGFASIIIMGGNAVLIPVVGWLLSYFSHTVGMALLIIPLLTVVNLSITTLIKDKIGENHV